MGSITLRELVNWWPPSYGKHVYELVPDDLESPSVEKRFLNYVVQLSNSWGITPHGKRRANLAKYGIEDYLLHPPQDDIEYCASWQFAKPWLGWMELQLDTAKKAIQIVLNAS